MTDRNRNSVKHSTVKCIIKMMQSFFLKAWNSQTTNRWDKEVQLWNFPYLFQLMAKWIKISKLA